MAPSLAVAPGRPFVHLLIPSRRPRWGKLFNRSMFDLSICQDYLGQVKPLPRSHPRPRLRRKGGVGRNGETARAVAVNDGAQAPPQGLSLTATSTTLAS